MLTSLADQVLDALHDVIIYLADNAGAACRAYCSNLPFENRGITSGQLMAANDEAYNLRAGRAE